MFCSTLLVRHTPLTEGPTHSFGGSFEFLRGDRVNKATNRSIGFSKDLNSNKTLLVTKAVEHS